MAQIDVSGITYLLPLFSFMLVWVIVFAVLQKSKLVEQKGLQIFLGFVLATIFISATGPIKYVENVSAWFMIFLLSLFLILLIMGLVGKPVESLHKGIGIAFVVLVILMFIVSAIVVFNDSLGPFLPWNYSNGYGNNFSDWLYSGRVIGAGLLIIVSAIVSYFLASGKK